MDTSALLLPLFFLDAYLLKKSFDPVFSSKYLSVLLLVNVVFGVIYFLTRS